MKQWFNRLALLALLIALNGLCACQNPPPKAISAPVPFRLLHNYFVRNNVPDGEWRELFTSKKAFNARFGMAAFMGPKGKPSTIDFEQEAVLAVISPKQKQEVSLQAQEVTTAGETLTFSYIHTMGAPLSYTIRPCLLIAIPLTDLKPHVVFSPTDALKKD